MAVGVLILQVGGERRTRMWQLAIKVALDIAWRRQQSIGRVAAALQSRAGYLRLCCFNRWDFCRRWPNLLLTWTDKHRKGGFSPAPNLHTRVYQEFFNGESLCWNFGSPLLPKSFWEKSSPRFASSYLTASWQAIGGDNCHLCNTKALPNDRQAELNNLSRGRMDAMHSQPPKYSIPVLCTPLSWEQTFYTTPLFFYSHGSNKTVPSSAL